MPKERLSDAVARLHAHHGHHGTQQQREVDLPEASGAHRVHEPDRLFRAGRGSDAGSLFHVGVGGESDE